MPTPVDPTHYITWLLDHAMLAQANAIATRYAGQGALWQHPYGAAQPRAAAARASVWLTAYPAAIVTRPGESILQTLGDAELWQALATIGVSGLHTGPMKQSGGVQSESFTPTIDGNFDRISMTIDPALGSEADYARMVQNATAHGATIIGDIIPGHTGKGADFRLAERGYGDYPGLYHMVQIRAEDWPLLPNVPAGMDAANLAPAAVDALQVKGYIVGQLPRVIFYEPGVKETDWSATPPIQGADGVTRRWVYLHYFKAGQPALNWLDPTFAAHRLVIGDTLHSLGTLGVGMVRLDANGFLGIERTADGRVWSEGHPLSRAANQLIAGMARKMGGFSFQELNLTVDDIAAMSQGGADLSYDFITRPAYHHALVTGNTEFLRLMLRTMHDYEIDPAALIHALQNHDELTLELVHFWTLHKDDGYTLAGRDMTGTEVREQIRRTMYERLTGAATPYNLRFVTNGVACTTASVIAAALGIRDLDAITPEQRQQIQRLHLLLVMYNACQPGVFALSGWDLVGALPLNPESVQELMTDGDTRWINRGAYDLMNVNSAAQKSSVGLPKARALYGSLPEQLADPASFARQLQRILEVRQRYRIFESRQIAVPDVASQGLLVMVHELPDGAGRQVTALNFGGEPVRETITIPGLHGEVVDLFSGKRIEQTTTHGQISISLEAHAGMVLLARSAG